MNFHGKHLNAMVDEQYPFIVFKVFDHNWTQVPFHGSNSTYDVTNYTEGIFNMVLESMQHQLNFTTSLYKRLDGYWGTLGQNSLGKYHIIE
jgi:hypothetical protein